ncbi:MULTISPECIES: hypothetical protein [unclassified Rathayibacter]|uniref:hypothetical protein n=1 Tax=unclassified Rathayibacter TaxID=2609250 RepID=UPI0006F6465F|nr:MULTISPECIES: hypothetical protein [unclassified Rathayibacter]KQQ04062.1 hypothetical protein ASF42_11620 [Rathayibacter sp. Leaf294]KQS12516.1 hypothetical protein ASG06_11620 [Rathayibacter sp. Leaf185]
MRFRLRRRQPAPEVVAAPALTQDELFAVVHERLAAFVGEQGAWVVTRRSHDDRDPIFHGMLARSLAHELSSAIQAEQVRAGVEATSSPITEAIPVMTASTPPVTSDDVTAAEPAALTWEPQPIAVWAEPSQADRADAPAVADSAL